MFKCSWAIIHTEIYIYMAYVKLVCINIIKQSRLPMEDVFGGWVREPSLTTQ